MEPPEQAVDQSVDNPGVSRVSDALTGLKANLSEAFKAFEGQRSLLENVTSRWHDVESYIELKGREFAEREELIRTKELEAEAAVKAREKSLDKRESEIAIKEAEAALRVQKLKDSAIAAVTDAKEKAEVANGDATKSSIAKTKAALQVPASKGSPAGKAGSIVAKATGAQPSGGPKGAKGTPGDGARATVGKGLSRGADDGNDKAPRPELVSLCEGMDAAGLWKFLFENKRELGSVRPELTGALQRAIDPALLVVQVLENWKIGESSMKADKRNPGLGRVSISLLEALSSLSRKEASTAQPFVITSAVQEMAKKLADTWMESLSANGQQTHLEGQTILELLSTFGIRAHYAADKLVEYLVLIAKWKRASELCRELSLEDKVPELVDTLAKEGKVVEALRFAHEFGIMERVDPVPMLRTFLKESKKAAQVILKNEQNFPPLQAQNEAATKEISTLNLVLQCIKDFDIAGKFPPAPLEKRLAELEKAKADRKREKGGGGPIANLRTKRGREYEDSFADAGRYPKGGSMGSRPFGGPSSLSSHQSHQLSYATGGLSSRAYGEAPAYDRRPGPTVVYTPSGGLSAPIGQGGPTYMYAAEGPPLQQYVPGAYAQAAEPGGYGMNFRY